MRGMRDDGVLTSVDVEAEHQRLARKAFAAAGFPAQRVRLIPGAALDVLPRLTEEHYDLVFCDGDKEEYPRYLEQALRLLRPGGVVAIDNALWHDKVAEPAVRDAATTAVRETLDAARADERLVPLLLPVGDGLLVAQKRLD
jgi:predicted O-methyltransferase YrrM